MTRASVCGDGASPSRRLPAPLSATRHSSGGWNPGAQRGGGSVGGEGTEPPVIPAEAGIQARKRSVGRLGERVLSHPSFQRRLESRRAAQRVLSQPVIPAEAGIQARSARWVGWGRGYSATRHSSGGWNPGAQRAAGRLGERVLSHPSFQRRLESRRASARWGDWEVRVLREWGAGCVPGLLNATSVACRPHWIPASAGMTRHRAGAARSAMGRHAPAPVPLPH